MKWACLATATVAAVSGCGGNELTAEKARGLADAAMTQHCVVERAACDSLRFTEASKNDGLWLVEYESKTHLYGVIVDRNGSVEITRTPEK